MTDESALMAAILANPADDLLRLVYADWCDENAGPCSTCSATGTLVVDDADGSPVDWRCNKCGGTGSNRYAERAEYIRLSIAHAGHGDSSFECDICSRLTKLGADSDWWGVYRQHLHAALSFRRGFPEIFHSTAEDWLRRADYLCKLHPITEVTLTTEFPLDSEYLPSLRNSTFWISSRSRDIHYTVDERSFQAYSDVVSHVSEVMIQCRQYLLSKNWPRIKFTQADNESTRYREVERLSEYLALRWPGRR